MSKTNKKRLIVVYTDGSCMGNGNSNAPGGIGIHFPDKELADISKIYRLGYCTNQKTELYAILTALRYIKMKLGLTNYRVLIKTDSEYSINCITKWVYGWIKNGWLTKNKKPVANKEFIEAIHAYYEAYDIEFEHVDGHTGLDDPDSIGNAKADELATRATRKAILERNKTRQLSGSGSKSSRPLAAPKALALSPLQYETSSDEYSSRSVGTNRPVRRTLRPRRTPNKRSSSKFPKNANFIVELIKSKN